MSGRILAIGDVHGCDRALATLLSLLAITSADTVVFLGDLVDRGPSSKQVVDRVIALHEECEVVCIMGNHEEMMRDAISGRGLFQAWLDVGGQSTVDSYGGSIDNVPPEHIRFLMSASPFWESNSEIFIHANLESSLSLLNQDSQFLRWKHLGGMEPPHISGKRVVCGHTSQIDGKPLVFEGWVCIDTFPHGGKWLTGFDVDANHFYQASDSGETRDFPISAT